MQQNKIVVQQNGLLRCDDDEKRVAFVEKSGEDGSHALK